MRIRIVQTSSQESFPPSRGPLLGRLVVVLLVVVGAILPAASASATAARASGPTWSTATVSAVAAQPTVKLGSRGAAVVALQKRLTALRYDCGSVDGTFGDMTLHGVYAFQKVQRIGVDGIVGPNTWARLARPTVPTPRYTSSKAAVEVNLTLRVVYLTASGVVTRIVDASPGKASTPTPTGSFSILRRISGWRESDLGLLYRPNYFYRGYALHGSTSVPTYAASHGCVRVTVSAMDRLWPVLSIGERLYVYR